MENNSIINLLNKICVAIIGICCVGLLFVASVVTNRTNVNADILNVDERTNLPGLIFSLPEGIDFSMVDAEYENKGVRIQIPTNDEKYYYDNALVGDSSHIVGLSYGYKEGEAVFDIAFDDYCESELLDAGGGMLQLIIEPVKEKYENIYVIDPLHGGSDSGSVVFGVRECDVNLSFAKSLKKNLESEDTAVFLTRLSDVDVSDEDRIKMAKDLGAKVFIRVGLKASSTTRISHGVEFATSDYEKMNKLSSGFESAGIEAKYVPVSKVFDKDGMPLIVVYPGYITNKSDVLLLSTEEYLDKISAAIADALE